MSNMQLEKWSGKDYHTTSSVHTVLRERADNTDYSKRVLTPQLYVLSKYLLLTLEKTDVNI